MRRILVTCPRTGRSAPTGYWTTDLDLAALVGPRSFRCACGDIHIWTAVEAAPELKALPALT